MNNEEAPPSSVMNESNYSQQSIIDYLLGDLPEAENEHYDELSFTDDDFSDCLNSAENDLIDAYLNDELKGAALEKFQTHYLASPFRREKIEFAKALQATAAKNYAPPNLKTSDFVELPEKRRFSGFGELFVNPALGWSFAAIVLLVLTLAGFWFVKRNSDQTENDSAMRQTPTVSPSGAAQTETPPVISANETENLKNSNLSPHGKETPSKKAIVETPPKSKESINSPVIASFVLSPPLRGAGNLPTVSFSKETTVIRMALNLESDDYKTYRVALVDESNKSLWQSGNLKSSNKRVAANFSAGLLRSGVYSLVLSGVNGEGETEILSNYSFKSMLK